MNTAKTGAVFGMEKNFFLFFTAICCFGFAQSMYDASFNNFLNETYAISSANRGFLELPRELPGFLVIFISALFFFLCPRRLAALANLIMALGLVMIAFFAPEFRIMLVWLFILSIGQHLFLPLYPAIAMELSDARNAGAVLGRLNGVQNVAAIFGSLVVFAGFRYLDFSFSTVFVISALGFVASSAFVFFMKKGDTIPPRQKFLLRKRYGLFYWLNILYGTRKQLFLTFGPWVIVREFSQPTQTVATLLAIGGVAGIIFKPLLGHLIDKKGERFVLVAEAVVLVAVCLLYAFSKRIFSFHTAFLVTAGCYLVDYMLMAVSMARTTYLRKIAVHPSEISQTLTMGVSIDHFFSIAIALASGLVWLHFGYEYVFMIGALIAFVNMISASFIRVPERVPEAVQG